MIGLLQRVSNADVRVDDAEIASIGRGLLVLVGFRRDERKNAGIERFVERLLAYRVFADEAGKMNRSLRDVAGGLLIVPQFTLAADTTSGNRPGFSTAAAPETGRALFDELCAVAAREWPGTAFGRFGADMAVALVNDGPVTFWLEL